MGNAKTHPSAYNKEYNKTINKLVDGKEKDLRGYIELEENRQVIVYVDVLQLVDSSRFLMKCSNSNGLLKTPVF